MPDNDTIKRLIRKGTIARQFVPMVCGTAFKNKGVQTLLDAVVDYLPSPLDIPDVQVGGPCWRGAPPAWPVAEDERRYAWQGAEAAVCAWLLGGCARRAWTWRTRRRR